MCQAPLNHLQKRTNRAVKITIQAKPLFKDSVNGDCGLGIGAFLNFAFSFKTPLPWRGQNCFQMR